MRIPLMVISCVALLALGVLLGQFTQVRAQSTPPQYRECFAALTWAFSGSVVNEEFAAGQKPSKVTRVPAGWTPIGGGSRGTDGIIILCR